MHKNTLKTYLLLAALGGFLVFLGRTFLGPSGATIGLVIAFVMVGGSYWFSDKLAIRASRAQPVTEQEAPELYRMVRELTMAAQMPMPRLYMTPDPQPNAFATGRNEKHAAVAVTSGIMELLSPDELRGVLAHELAHVKNRDILIGSVAAAIATAISYAAHLAFFFGGSDDDEGGNPIAALATLLLAPIAAGLIQMAISRSREFEADRSGAALINNGEPLARALEKLHLGAQKIPMKVDPAQATKFIVNPLTGRKVSFAKLFSTHPPMEERIARLRAPLAQG
ncbi:MAG TPA: zinc metalloprotease HtpX [Actinomycetota bacterium]|nr:zinc metalloprotease HtpX [Actinomycetota bacterium]